MGSGFPGVEVEMEYPQEFCPQCQAIQNMNVSLSFVEIVDKEKGTQEALFLNYHCFVCRSLVYRESVSSQVEGQRTADAVRWPSILNV